MNTIPCGEESLTVDNAQLWADRAQKWLSTSEAATEIGQVVEDARAWASKTEQGMRVDSDMLKQPITCLK